MRERQARLLLSGALDRHPMKRVLLVLGVAAGLLTGPTDASLASEHGPGNSENAPGHDPAGPGNSENAPGHGGARQQNAPGHRAHGPANGRQPAGERGGSSGGSTLVLPAQLLPAAPCRTGGTGGCRVPLAADGPSEIAVPSSLPRGSPPAGALADAIACREGIVRAATPYNARSIDAFTVGDARIVEGGRMVPLFVRIVYSTASGEEVRQATVTCQLNESGAAVALLS